MQEAAPHTLWVGVLYSMFYLPPFPEEDNFQRFFTLPSSFVTQSFLRQKKKAYFRLNFALDRYLPVGYCSSSHVDCPWTILIWRTVRALSSWSWEAFSSFSQSTLYCFLIVSVLFSYSSQYPCFMPIHWGLDSGTVFVANIWGHQYAPGGKSWAKPVVAPTHSPNKNKPKTSFIDREGQTLGESGCFWEGTMIVYWSGADVWVLQYSIILGCE